MRFSIPLLTLLVLACGSGESPSPKPAPVPEASLADLELPLSPLTEEPTRRIGFPEGEADTAARIGVCLDLLESGTIPEVEWAAEELGRIGGPAVAPLAEAMLEKLPGNPAFARNALLVFSEHLPAPSAWKDIAAVGASPDSPLLLDVARALGRSGSAEAVPVLVGLAMLPDFRVSSAALAALGELPPGPVAEELLPAFPDELSPATRASAIPLLAAGLPETQRRKLLGGLLDSPDAAVAVTAAIELLAVDREAGRAALREWVGRGIPVSLELEVHVALAGIRDEASLPRLIALAGGGMTAPPAAELLGQYEDPRAREALRGLADSPDKSVAAAAIVGLVGSGAPDARALLDARLSSEDRDERFTAALVLGRLEGEKWARLAAEAADAEADRGVRIKFLNALGIHGRTVGAGAAVRAIEDEDEWLPGKADLAMNGADALLAMPGLPDGAEERLRALARKGEPSQKVHAGRVLGRHGKGPETKEVLLALLRSDYPDVRMVAAAAWLAFDGATPEPLLDVARRERNRQRAETIRKAALRLWCRSRR